MATQILLRRGARNPSTVIADGEAAWDSAGKVLYVGDGVTPGGIAVNVATGASKSGSSHVANARPIISAATTLAVSPAADVSPYNAAYTVQGGGAPYTANLTLTAAAPSQGDMIWVELQLPASTNPTIAIYNASTGGTLLATVTCDGSGTAWLGLFVYTGNAWELEKAISTQPVTAASLPPAFYPFAMRRGLLATDNITIGAGFDMISTSGFSIPAGAKLTIQAGGKLILLQA